MQKSGKIGHVKVSVLRNAIEFQTARRKCFKSTPYALLTFKTKVMNSKRCKTVGLIANLRHSVAAQHALLNNIYHALILPYLSYGWFDSSQISRLTKI